MIRLDELDDEAFATSVARVVGDDEDVPDYLVIDVAGALKTLSKREYTVLLLLIESQTPVSEVAQQLGIVESTVRSIRSRALNKIRRAV